MKYIDFYRKFKDRALIDVKEINIVFPDFDTRRLNEWQKRGHIKKLSRGFYIFGDARIGDAEKNFIANKLFGPSYVSLEYALSYYSLIPETVHLLTSITTRRTKTIETPLVNFQYRSVKERLFFGYRIVEADGISYRIAEPEKALLDFLYLRSDIRNNGDIEELRLDREMFKEKVDQDKMNKYLQEFDSKTLFLKIIKINKKMK